MPDFRANRQPLVSPGEIEHHIGDMSATIAADVTLAAVQAKLGEAGQWLPIDGDPSLPVGQLVENNSTGPLRLGYGAWRDLLLGAQFANGRGELITAGGRTMKNVAGYDLTKFMVGQGGVFGQLVTITTRSYKRPTAALFAGFAPDLRRLPTMLSTQLKPQWCTFEKERFVCGYLGDDEYISFIEAHLPGPQDAQIGVASVEGDIEARALAWRGDFRIAVPPARVVELISKAQLGKWIADPAFGIVLGTLSTDTPQLRKAVSDMSGTITVFGDPHFEVDLSPQNRTLLERLKSAFDPDNRLKPLPWQS